MSAFQRLAEILGPPQHEVVPTPWGNSLRETGIQFPVDYRKIIDTYGHVTLNGELHITGPSSKPGQPGAPVGFKGFQYATADLYGFCGLLAVLVENTAGGVSWAFMWLAGTR